MTTIYECDWCGDEFTDREMVASVDLTIGAANEKLHMCVTCAPEWVRQHYPDRVGEPSGEAAATDGGEDIPAPDVTVGDRVRLCAQHNGENEYVDGVVATVHSQQTIDVLYRVESRREHGGDGRFERDDHTDRYEFATSCVYMADVNGWLAGWDHDDEGAVRDEVDADE